MNIIAGHGEKLALGLGKQELYAKSFCRIGASEDIRLPSLASSMASGLTLALTATTIQEFPNAPCVWVCSSQSKLRNSGKGTGERSYLSCKGGVKIFVWHFQFQQWVATKARSSQADKGQLKG